LSSAAAWALGFFASSASASWIAFVAACSSFSRNVMAWSNIAETML
jgi:hypothetical protein